MSKYEKSDAEQVKRCCCCYRRRPWACSCREVEESAVFAAAIRGRQHSITRTRHGIATRYKNYVKEKTRKKGLAHLISKDLVSRNTNTPTTSLPAANKARLMFHPMVLFFGCDN